jgi:rhodanese-related sulfurtransferase
MDDFTAEPDWLALDLRHPQEAQPCVKKFGRDRWAAIPYNEIRKRHVEVPADKTMIIVCDAGTRSYEVQVFLDHVGKRNSLVLSGGFNVIRRIGVDWIPR